MPMTSLFSRRTPVPPEIKPAILAARRDFALLAATGGINIFALFTILFDKPGTWIGLIVGAVFFVAVADRGRAITKKPGSTHLAKARTWAYLLHITVPIGPFVAPHLLEILHQRELVSYAVADDPNLKTLTKEGIIGLTRIKCSLTSLRSIGGALLIIAIFFTIVFVASDYSAPNSKAPGIIGEVGIFMFGMYVFALSHIVAGTIGLRLIRTPNRQQIATLRIISMVSLLFFPFGTWTGGLILFLIHPKQTDFFH